MALFHADADYTEWAVESDGDVLVEFGEDEAEARTYAESHGGSVLVGCVFETSWLDQSV